MDIPIEEEVKESYLVYALSVIVSRAIPDVRDGLKPVQRRILYSMNELGLKHNRPFKKSARVVGEVLGKYHPHGDSAIYDTLVRMAQPFSLRYPLVDGQGNFGSLDNDPPAAMRYTEVRMNKISEELLKDIDFDTVDFTNNFDNTLKEPVVLPTRIPNLLINGTSGIAVGMASNIPPHNLNEVVDALISIIEEKSEEEVLNCIKGPDFPTGGIIIGENALNSYKHTGKGLIKVRAKTEIKDNKILITEIPYMVSKTKIIEDIVKNVNNGVINEIADLHDRSDKKGLLIEIKLKHRSNPEIVLNKLFKHTSLQTTFGVNQIALVNGKPQLLSLYDILKYFLSFRREVIRRKTNFLLQNAENRKHIVEGLLIALNNIDYVVSSLRKAENTQDALKKLMNLNLTEKQAKAVMDMKLSTLVNTEKEKLEEELKSLMRKIEEYNSILNNPKILDEKIKNELVELKQQYGDTRRTSFMDDVNEQTIEDYIQNKDVVILMSKKGYVKRMLLDEFKKQHRGGKGVIGNKKGETVEHMIITKNLNYLLLFTDDGRVYWLKAYKIPQFNHYAKGVHISSLLEDLKGNVVEITSVDNFDKDYLIFLTKNGKIKKTRLIDYSHPRRTGVIGIKLKQNDLVVSVKRVGEEPILISTKSGMTICFDTSTIRPLGRNSEGVRAIRLKHGDSVVSLTLLRKPFILFITRKGKGKLVDKNAFKLQHRGGTGVRGIKMKPDDELIGTANVDKTYEILITSESGRIIRISVDEISNLSRYAQGVRVARFNEPIKTYSVISVL